MKDDTLYASWDFCKRSDGTGSTMEQARYDLAERTFLPMLGDQLPWQKARGVEFAPNRGIVDYGWTADFGRRLTKDELIEVCGWLHNHPRCPGWTGVNGREYNTDKGFVYGFSTTMDSSD